MFSYRHAFHAGNHADVLKHLVLIHSIRYLQEKDGGPNAGVGLIGEVNVTNLSNVGLF